MEVSAIHPLLAIARPSVATHQPEVAEWSASEHADAAKVDGAVGLARTTTDVLCDGELRSDMGTEFAAAGGPLDVAALLPGGLVTRPGAPVGGL